MITFITFSVPRGTETRFRQSELRAEISVSCPRWKTNLHHPGGLGNFFPSRRGWKNFSIPVGVGQNSQRFSTEQIGGTGSFFLWNFKIINFQHGIYCWCGCICSCTWLAFEEKAARIDFFLNKGTWQQFLSELRSKGKYESVLKDFIEPRRCTYPKEAMIWKEAWGEI